MTARRRAAVRWSRPGEPGRVTLDWPDDLRAKRGHGRRTHYERDEENRVVEVSGKDDEGYPVGVLLRHGLDPLIAHTDHILLAKVRLAYWSARRTMRR